MWMWCIQHTLIQGIFRETMKLSKMRMLRLQQKSLNTSMSSMGKTILPARSSASEKDQCHQWWILKMWNLPAPFNSFTTTRNERLSLLLGKDRSISKSLPIWEPSLIKCTRTGCTSHPTAEYIMTARPWSSSSLISMHVNSNFPTGRVFIWWTISTEPQKTNHSQHPWSTRHFALLCTSIIMFHAYFILWLNHHECFLRTYSPRTGINAHLLREKRFCLTNHCPLDTFGQKTSSMNVVFVLDMEW